ncbi:MAG: DUF4124 domain-containing protein [Mariprofundaceae bacterium]|nr:DUF4124 domain-containing protein [Mariprofundaceae bacterium]
MIHRMKRHPNILSTIAILILYLCLSSTVSADVYKWTDVKGTVHFSTTAPSKEKIKIAEKIKIKGSNNSTAQGPLNKDAIAGLITLEDLRSLGCTPTSKVGSYASKVTPLFGKISRYILRSKEGCTIDLVNSVQKQKSEGYDSGLWSGIRASLLKKSKGYKVDKKQRNGNIGHYSEITDFTRKGQYKGFNYTVQDKGVVYRLTIFSDDIKPNKALEEIILNNISSYLE